MNSALCRVVLSILVIFLFAAGAAEAQGLIAKPADIIVIHGRVYTENPKQPWAQAVDGYTLGAAFAGRREKTEGSLEVGKLADLIIISQNIFDVNPHKIGATKVFTMFVGGRLVYQADSK